MVDSIAILPELSFIEQIEDLSAFLARSLPEAEKSQFVGSINKMIDSHTQSQSETPADGEEVKNDVSELSSQEKNDAVNTLVAVITEGHPGFEGVDREIEAQYLLLTTLILSISKSDEILMNVIDAVVRSAAGSKKAEVACRVLVNMYNLLPPASPTRSRALVSLLQLLTSSSVLELSFFPLSPSWLSSTLSQWDLSIDQKLSWLQNVAEIYEVKGTKGADREKGLELRVFALQTAAQQGDASAIKACAHKALKSLLAIPTKFELDEVLSVHGARDNLDARYSELVDLFESGELAEGLGWVSQNSSFLSEQGLDADEIIRKLRLLALTSLAAKSSTKEISYQEAAQALKLEEVDVEIYVIDAIHSGLLKASLSQPTKTLRVQSVQTRSFGSSEWQLLDKRLSEWKTVLDDVQKSIQEAIVINEQSGKEQGRGGHKKGTRRPNKTEDVKDKSEDSTVGA